MKTYNIANLIIFWESQLHNTFKDIIRVLEIVDDNSPEETKLDRILDVLRGAGLFEEDYQAEHTEEQKQAIRREVERRSEFKMEELSDENLLVPIDVYEASLLNSQRIKILIILN